MCAKYTKRPYFNIIRTKKKGVLMKLMLTAAMLITIAASGGALINDDPVINAPDSDILCLEEYQKILEWKYPDAANGEKRAWDSRGYNETGGHNLWCISPLYAVCGLWSWRTVYPSDTPVEVIPMNYRCAAYGHQLVLDAAAAEGITLPDDFGPPVYNEYGF